MKTVSLLDPSHNFQKLNGMTLKDRKGCYDLYECSNCKQRGKRRGVSDELEVTSIKPCNTDKLRGHEIQVVRCNAVGGAFANAIPGSIHKVTEPPKGYTNGARGVWIEGVGEPILLLYGEFQLLS